MKEKKMSAEKTAKPKLMNIKLEKLHPFEDHPYKVLDDESMTELVESIKEYGFLNRIIVRPLEDKPDEYENQSGIPSENSHILSQKTGTGGCGSDPRMPPHPLP